MAGSLSSGLFLQLIFMDKKEQTPKIPDTTQKSIDNGRKAIETEEKTAGKPAGEVKKDQEKDAEKWRNEG